MIFCNMNADYFMISFKTKASGAAMSKYTPKFDVGNMTWMNSVHNVVLTFLCCKYKMYKPVTVKCNLFFEFY